MYNAVLSKVYKRYNWMRETKMYRQLKQKILQSNKKERKPLYKQLNQLYKDYSLNEYSFHDDIKKMQHHFKTNIDSFTAQKIATRVWKSMEGLLFGNGDRVHFKKYGDLDSVEGKSNKSGIRFSDNKLIWNGLNVPVKIDYSNQYEYQALQDKICYCRIKRKFVKARFKYYLQLVFKGSPPNKLNSGGGLKRSIGNGNVGLDIGTQSIAISSNTEVKLLELADRVQDIEDEKEVVLLLLATGEHSILDKK